MTPLISKLALSLSLHQRLPETDKPTGNTNRIQSPVA